MQADSLLTWAEFPSRKRSINIQSSPNKNLIADDTVATVAAEGWALLSSLIVSRQSPTKTQPNSMGVGEITTLFRYCTVQYLRGRLATVSILVSLRGRDTLTHKQKGKSHTI